MKYITLILLVIILIIVHYYKPSHKPNNIYESKIFGNPKEISTYEMRHSFMTLSKREFFNEKGRVDSSYLCDGEIIKQKTIYSYNKEGKLKSEFIISNRKEDTVYKKIIDYNLFGKIKTTLQFGSPADVELPEREIYRYNILGKLKAIITLSDGDTTSILKQKNSLLNKRTICEYYYVYNVPDKPFDSTLEEKIIYRNYKNQMVADFYLYDYNIGEYEKTITTWFDQQNFERYRETKYLNDTKSYMLFNEYGDLEYTFSENRITVIQYKRDSCLNWIYKEVNESNYLKEKVIREIQYF